MNGHDRTDRLAELEDGFQALAGQSQDSPEWQAVSILHAMVQELWRSGEAGVADPAERGWPASAIRPTLSDIANLYKRAPSMSGSRQHEPLRVGSIAPDFTLPDANGREVSLRDFRGAPVVVAFYPLDWSPTCSDQLSLYQAELDEFQRVGASVVGISVDSVYSHGAWAAVRGIAFPLLSDFEPKGAVARRYNAYRPGDGFSERALYVIDADGVIRYAHVAPQLDHIPDIYELFASLAELTGKPQPEPSSLHPVDEGVAATAGG